MKSIKPSKQSGLESFRLATLTFLAVGGITTLVGLAVVPFIIRKMETQYLTVQSDNNEQRARALARFAELRIKDGHEAAAVSADLQAILTGADVNRGYSCIVDRADSSLICHPLAEAIGKQIPRKDIQFISSEGNLTAEATAEPWVDAIARAGTETGKLITAKGKSEIVHMQPIEGTNWTVATHENTETIEKALAKLRATLILGAIGIGLLLAVPSSFAARAVNRQHERHLENERERSDRLLLNILPEPIAERLKSSDGIIADRHDGITVLFADIVGFTPLAAKTSAADLVAWLNEVVSLIDDICTTYQLEKIKTIGDAYMLCGGLSGDKKQSAENVIKAGQDMLKAVQSVPLECSGGRLNMRIGVHTGELIAGVIGKRKIAYDVWGDVVNTASRIESSGIPGQIQISSTTADLVREKFELESRGSIPIKGKGEMELWLVREG